MATVVFYFQVHQPFRLRRYSVFDSDPFYFEDAKNGSIAEKVADKIAKEKALAPFQDMYEVQSAPVKGSRF